MVRVVPAGTELGDIEVIDIEERIVNIVELPLDPALVVTTKGPLVAPEGTYGTIVLAPQ
jgi:hypothetical protein